MTGKKAAEAEQRWGRGTLKLMSLGSIQDPLGSHLVVMQETDTNGSFRETEAFQQTAAM